MLILAKADLVKRDEIDMICKQISVQENIPVYSTSNTVCVILLCILLRISLCYNVTKFPKLNE